MTIELCKKYNSNVIIRGLRAVSDFNTISIGCMNKKLNSNIETMFLSDVEKQIISSKFVKDSKQEQYHRL